MAKIPAAQMHLKLEDLAKKLAAGFTDKEIMQNLQLKRRTFYNYKAKVCKMFGNISEKRQNKY
jgi:DNA-binding CsgD family transcriptional regulator